MLPVNKISLEGTDQMLSFILLSCTHQNQLPDFHLAAGRQTHFFFCLQECVCWRLASVCVWSGMRPLVLIQKCFSRLAACILLKHQSDLKSHTDVCRALPLVDCVRSARCCILNYSTTLSDVLYTQVPGCPEPPSSYTTRCSYLVYLREVLL